MPLSLKENGTVFFCPQLNAAAPGFLQNRERLGAMRPRFPIKVQAAERSGGAHTAARKQSKLHWRTKRGAAYAPGFPGRARQDSQSSITSRRVTGVTRFRASRRTNSAAFPGSVVILGTVQSVSQSETTRTP